MQWPLASQFSAMLQRPETAFRDPALKAFSIERDRFGQPRPWDGGVCRRLQRCSTQRRGRPMALRVFSSASPERRDRYDAVSAYLRGRRVRCLVDFEYRDESVRAAGHTQWFPLILMDWIQGDTLYQWAAARCRAGDGQALAGAASRWVELVAELEAAEIAHGDLQHANVMVAADGQLKLVDYDGMVRSRFGRASEPGDWRQAVSTSPAQRPNAVVAGIGPLFGDRDLRGPAGIGRRARIVAHPTSTGRSTTSCCSPPTIFSRHSIARWSVN